MFHLPLKICKCGSITLALQKLKTMTGKLSTRSFTAFDQKILCEAVASFCADNNSLMLAVPSDQLYQNGLVERAWKTISEMAWSYITDKQMPRSYWYWDIRYTSCVHNIFLVQYN